MAKDKTYTGVRLETELRDRLQACADKEKSSVSRMVSIAVEFYLDAYESENE